MTAFARTTPQVRAELQTSQDTTRALARRYGLSRTTAATWRTRTPTDDAPMGPSASHSTVLTLADEATAVEFRRRTLLPLDGLERHGISRLPDSPDQASKRGQFAQTAIGCVHISKLRLAQGTLNMVLAIDRVPKFT